MCRSFVPCSESRGPTTGRGRRQTNPIRCIPRRTVSGLKRMFSRSCSSKASSSQDQRLRKKPKSCGVKETSQRITTISQEATDTVRCSVPSTRARPPERKSAFHCRDQRRTGERRAPDLPVGMLVGQQQQHQSTACRSRRPVHLQTGLAFLRRKSNTAIHGLVSGIVVISTHKPRAKPFPFPKHLSRYALSEELFSTKSPNTGMKHRPPT